MNEIEKRFTVEQQEFWTECECPPDLCPHAESGYMRPYYEWIVWDEEGNRGRGEHASITTERFQFSYERKRDAVAAVKRFEEES